MEKNQNIPYKGLPKMYQNCGILVKINHLEALLHTLFDWTFIWLKHSVKGVETLRMRQFRENVGTIFHISYSRDFRRPI
jgi:hypothetical protein